MNKPFSRYAWGVLFFNVAVVLWGGFVRATGSGAGCGSHWPLCNGEVVPRAPRLETIIEFTHRLTSGVALAAVVVLCLWAFRLFPRGDRLRRASLLALAFLIVEALLGAGLVLFRYVAQNASAGRAVYLALHLTNTQLLLAMLAAVAWFASGGSAWPGLRRAPRFLLVALTVALAASITGAIAALGDTLFPAASLSAGLRREFSGAAHALERLRLVHPAMAVASAVFLLAVALAVARSNAGRAVERSAYALIALVMVQLAAGALNVVLLAPVWMQILHLFLADLLWIALVILTLEAAAPMGERFKHAAAAAPHAPSLR